MLCFPGTSFLTGSVVDSREELAGASLNSGTLSSTRFSLNSANHSGISGNRSIRANSLSPIFLMLLSFWVAPATGLPLLVHLHAHFVLLLDAL